MLSPSAKSSDFPYVPKPEHIDAINEFCEVDFELLQGSPSPTKRNKGHKRRRTKHHQQQDTVFSICGESGSGKTSLLKYWSEQRKLKSRANAIRTTSSNTGNNAEPGSPMAQKEFIFYYGIESSRDAQLSNMLGKLESALKFHFQLRELAVRKSSAHRRWDLVRYLESSAKKSTTPIIVVIDGLSRLRMESGVEADPMLWLPRDLPNKVRVIVSLTEYEVPPVEGGEQKERRRKGSQNISMKKTASFVELERRKAPSLRLGVLSLATRRKILSTYAKYHRNAFDLSDDKVMQILASDGSGHPLYLRVLLNSLRTAARLSCIPAIAVGMLLDSVMEGELQGWSHDQKSETLVDTRNMSVVSTPRSRGSLTWEERQITMSKGASSAADREVAGLMGTIETKLTTRQQTMQAPAPSTLHTNDGALPSSVEMVISLALQRCEEDVEMEMDGSDTGLLGRVLSLLYVSHHGLTENELLGCVALDAQHERNKTGAHVKKAPQQQRQLQQQQQQQHNKWHENFQHQFEQHRETLRLILDDICMVVRSVDPSITGVVDSAMGGNVSMDDQRHVRVIMEHESVRRVVWRQYLGGSYAEKNRNHAMLANYFEKIVPVCPRRIEELPWHYEQLQQYSKLRDTVTDIDMFQLWWGDTHMEFYRPELIRIWSVLCMPPVGLDIVEEIRAVFEAQIIARHMRDDAISTLMLQVAELTIAFQRGGWESTAGLNCPAQKHPAIPLADLVQNGVPVLQPDPEGEESGEDRQFIELIKAARHSLEDGTAPAVNHEMTTFIGKHYHYSRWMWTQFPIILLGFSDMYSKRVAAMTAAKSSSMSAAESSPTKRDPIILRLRQLAHRLENPPLDPTEDDNTKNKGKSKGNTTTTNSNSNKKSSKNSNNGKRSGDSNEHEVFMTAATAAPQKKQQQQRTSTSISASSTSPNTSSAATHAAHPALAPKSKPHPNSPFFLDVHSSDRHEQRLESMVESIMKQRRVLNAMLIAERSKKKIFALKRDELTVLNGLSKGEEVSLESAMKVVSELDTVAARTAEADTLSNFYRLVLHICKAYSANQPEWLTVLDEEIAQGHRAALTTKELIAAVIEQRRDILLLLSEARTTQYHRRGVLSQMLDRLEYQHARELENVQNERQWKQRQAIMLRDDIVQENRLKMQRAEDERKTLAAQNEQRRQARDSKLAVWRDRIQRLKDATGVSSIEEMMTLVSSRSQSTTEQNLSRLVAEEETKITALTLQREQLRNEMMRLRFSYNQTGSGAVVAKKRKGNVPSPHKKELHALAEKEVAVQRAKTQVEQVRRELDRVNRCVMDVKVGLEHITRMCGIDYSNAEKAREEESKQPTMYFEVSQDISERDRAEATIDLLVKVEANLVGKIADLQRLAPRTPKSRDRKRRSRRSKSRDGRRRSKSRDGRVGSPLRCVLFCQISCFLLIYVFCSITIL